MAAHRFYYSRTSRAMSMVLWENRRKSVFYTIHFSVFCIVLPLVIGKKLWYLIGTKKRYQYTVSFLDSFLSKVSIDKSKDFPDATRANRKQHSQKHYQVGCQQSVFRGHQNSIFNRSFLSSYHICSFPSVSLQCQSRISSWFSKRIPQIDHQRMTSDVHTNWMINFGFLIGCSKVDYHGLAAKQYSLRKQSKKRNCRLKWMESKLMQTVFRSEIPLIRASRWRDWRRSHKFLWRKSWIGRISSNP